MIILACAGSLPGYWTAILTVDNLGRKPLQVLGFIVLTIIFCILGFAFHSLSEVPMLILYVAAQFFFNWGPNTTTFLVPGECFPTRYRSTSHGISAAMGKVGAILAQVISIPLLTRDSPEGCTGMDCSPWIDRLMQLFALFMFCGTFVSLLIPETKGATLEELAGEAPVRPSNTSRKGSSSIRTATQPPSWWAELNPFSGGQPAGFFYPGASGGRKGRRSPSSDIMSSPELAAQNAEAAAREKGLWYGRLMGRKERAPSSESSGYALSTASGGGDEMPMMPPSALPAWGGGWGRAGERGGVLPMTPMESIRLHDVGSLLK